MAILKIRDANGNVREISVIKGDRGERGPQGITGEKGDPGDATMQDISNYSDAIQTAYSYILQGRNLLRETNQGTKRWNYSHNGGEYTLVPSTEDDGKGIQLTIIKVGSYSFLQYDIHELLHQLEPNTKYILGFDYKATRGTPINLAIQAINSSGQLTDVQKPSLVGDSVWHRCEVALTTNDLGNITNQVLYIYLYSFVGELSIQNLKFEKGSQVTEWCPAPEDVIGDFPELTEATAKAFDEVERYVADHPKEEWIIIADITTTEEVASINITTDKNGNRFSCKRVCYSVILPTNWGGASFVIAFGCSNFWEKGMYFSIYEANRRFMSLEHEIIPSSADMFSANTSTTDGTITYNDSGSSNIKTGADWCGTPIDSCHLSVREQAFGFPIGTQIKIWGLKA